MFGKFNSRGNVMKNVMVVLLVLIVSSGSAWAVESGAGGVDNVTRVREGGAAGFTEVKGSTQGGALWLRVSRKCGDEEWGNLSPRKVNGDFSAWFNVGICSDGSTTVRSCLWRVKNGELMEGMVDCYDYKEMF